MKKIPKPKIVKRKKLAVLSHRTSCSRGRGGVWCDCKVKKPKRPACGSLAWYKSEWTEMTKGIDVVSDAFLSGLAELSYENKQLRARVSALEAIQLAQMFGMVEVQGTMHLLACAKRGEPDHTCTCGSTPDEEQGS